MLKIVDMANVSLRIDHFRSAVAALFVDSCPSLCVALHFEVFVALRTIFFTGSVAGAARRRASGAARRAAGRARRETPPRRRAGS